MVNLYKQEIEKVAMEKIATRAWKKHFVGLSDKNYNRLLQSGVYNPKKELQGLRRGTHAIMDKYNSKLVRKPNKAGAATVEIQKNRYDLIGKSLPDSVVDAVKREVKNKGPYSISTSPTQAFVRQGKPFNSTGKSGGMAYVPKNAINKTIKNNPSNENLTPISRRDRDGRKWAQAIAERHEADELRYSNINQKKGIGAAAKYNSHITPKVLMQESTHVAMMPRSIKNNPIKGIRGNDGELRDIQTVTGKPYASSAVYDKKGAKKMEDTAIKFNIWKAQNGYR